MFEPTERMLVGAKLYAMADRTDPFAYNRCVSHCYNGVVGFTLNGNDAIYNARPIQETRHYMDADGQRHEYTVTEYRDIVRP